MDPLRSMSLRELRRVIRLAARLHTRETARQNEERLREDLLRAAAEAGLTERHLLEAAAMLAGRKRRPSPGPRVCAFASLAAVLFLVCAAGAPVLRAIQEMEGPDPAFETAAVVDIPPQAPAVMEEPARGPADAGGYHTILPGLKYLTVRPGSGDPARAGETLRVHYTGWLAATHKKIDSSRDREEPFTFTLGEGQVIRGWEEGVNGMRPGEIRKLVMAPEFAYGEAGAGEQVPPNSTLIFEVERLGLARQPKAR